MYCKRCGAAIRDGAAFCPICGIKTDGVHPNYAQPGYAQPKKKSYAAITIAVSLFAVAAIFMALILGGVFPAGLGGSLANRQNNAAAAATLKPAAEPTEEPGHMDEITDEELLGYFCDVALNVEYGGVDGVVKRWEEPIRVQVSGDYTAEDYATLEEHIDALNRLGMLPDIAITDSDANYFIYFVPLDEMDDNISGYVEGNYGYFYAYWDGNYAINKAYMGIATDVTSQRARNHLILEEFTQSLGLMDDSSKYEDSIFQAEWTQTQALCDIDWELIRMLYSDNIHAGMKEADVIRVLGG